MAASEGRGVDWARGCAAVVPCFNEGLTVAEVVRGIRDHLPTVFVVDDGSADDTAAESSSAGGSIFMDCIPSRCG